LFIQSLSRSENQTKSRLNTVKSQPGKANIKRNLNYGQTTGRAVNLIKAADCNVSIRGHGYIANEVMKFYHIRLSKLGMVKLLVERRLSACGVRAESDNLCTAGLKRNKLACSWLAKI